MSDLNWSDLPRKATIKCGADVLSYRFVTTARKLTSALFSKRPSHDPHPTHHPRRCADCVGGVCMQPMKRKMEINL